MFVSVCDKVGEMTGCRRKPVRLTWWPFRDMRPRLVATAWHLDDLRVVAWCALVVGLALLQPARGFAGEETLRVAVFDVDASPPVGSPLAYDPTEEVEDRLRCRGIVLMGKDKPIVLCAIDWLGVANAAHDTFRRELATAVGTTPDRVAVHALHQHDAPRCDFSAEALLRQLGARQGLLYDGAFARRVMRRVAEAAKAALGKATPVTHIGLGEGRVEKVASNRRILGPDGKVRYVRFTACRDPKIRAAPVGTVDPMLKMISLWNDKRCIVALTYFATHPQSYYRTRKANPDFPGIARAAREGETGVFHVHFNGAGGNIGAGKWNDGSPKNRAILARRMEAGMRRAWEATKRYPITCDDVAWKVVRVALPPSPHLDEARLLAELQDTKRPMIRRVNAAKRLVWLRRCQKHDRIDIACLVLGKARVLHMPGELFVEYQLAAQKMRPDLFVAMAAYGDYGTAYIGTEIAYSQGGYETGPTASFVAPQVESVLMGALRQLLEAPPPGTSPPEGNPRGIPKG